jgi:hypothetical protein
MVLKRYHFDRFIQGVPEIRGTTLGASYMHRNNGKVFVNMVLELFVFELWPIQNWKEKESVLLNRLSQHYGLLF